MMRLNIKIFLFFFCLIVFATNNLAIAQVIPTPRAMWVWNWQIVNRTRTAEELFDFCKRYNINNLFFYAQVNFKDEKTAEAFENFLEKAHQKGIFVHALAGKPSWAVPSNHKRALRWVEQILNFNRKHRLIRRFDGIHFDVEPHCLGKSWEDKKETLLQGLVNLNKKTKDLIAKDGQFEKFGIAVPFWYDKEDLEVEWKGEKVPAVFALIDIVDYIAIMDYRNFAKSANGSIMLAEDEILYAAKVNKRVYIGQETQKNLEPDYITFGEDSVEYMEEELAKITEAFSDSRSFNGIAIHYYKSYKQLRQSTGK